MIVFKTFLKVLKACKVPIILYTIMLIAFGGFQMQTSENSINFEASKPDILIVNQDEEIGLTKNLIEYIKENCNLIEIENNEEARNDALFYRDVNYIIYIPKNFHRDFLVGKEPNIEIKSTGDYQSSYAEMLISRYLKTAEIYQKNGGTEKEIIQNINQTLEKKVPIEMISKLDTDHLAKAALYYNFANYSILAGCVYVICLILASFKEENVRKRTMISSMSAKTYQRNLLLSNSLFALVLWVFYIVLSFILVGKIMFTLHGLLLIANSFIFTVCAVTIAFFIGTLITNKNAINGIVNVVALGSSFLCGAFVPMEWLPDSVLKIAHILPSYYYIANNEGIKALEEINMETITPILLFMAIMLGFAILFSVLSRICLKKKEKIG